MNTIESLTASELARVRIMVKTFLRSAQRNPEKHSAGYLNELHTILDKLAND